MRTTINLKPCPFCGGGAEIKATRFGSGWFGECRECYARQLASGTEEAAATAWNTRSSEGERG